MELSCAHKQYKGCVVLREYILQHLASSYSVHVIIGPNKQNYRSERGNELGPFGLGILGTQ